VGEHGAELAVNAELGSAAWAIDFEGASGLFGHQRILRLFPELRATVRKMSGAQFPIIVSFD
jgi:hypothetical protein